MGGRKLFLKTCAVLEMFAVYVKERGLPQKTCVVCVLFCFFLQCASESGAADRTAVTCLVLT